MNDRNEVESNTNTGAENRTREDNVRSDFTLTPEVDIYEDAGGIHVQADMPGVSRERLDIQVNKDVLTIEGEARIDMPDKMEALYADVRATRYHRSFVLSAELDTDNIDARLKDGVLTVRIPKKAEARPRRIEVNAG